MHYIIRDLKLPKVALNRLKSPKIAQNRLQSLYIFEDFQQFLQKSPIIAKNRTKLRRL